MVETLTAPTVTLDSMFGPTVQVTPNSSLDIHQPHLNSELASAPKLASPNIPVSPEMHPLDNILGQTTAHKIGEIVNEGNISGENLLGMPIIYQREMDQPKIGRERLRSIKLEKVQEELVITLPQTEELIEVKVNPEITQVVKTWEAFKQAGLEDEEVEELVGEVVKQKGLSLVEVKKVLEVEKCQVSEKKVESEEDDEEPEELFYIVARRTLEIRKNLGLEAVDKALLSLEEGEVLTGKKIAVFMPGENEVVKSPVLKGSLVSDGSYTSLLKDLERSGEFKTELEARVAVEKRNDHNRPVDIAHKRIERLAGFDEVKKVYSGLRVDRVIDDLAA